MDFSRIKILAEQKNIPIKKLYDALGMTRQGFDKAIRTKSITVVQLEIISQCLRINTGYWFEKPVAKEYKEGEPVFWSVQEAETESEDQTIFILRKILGNTEKLLDKKKNN